MYTSYNLFELSDMVQNRKILQLFPVVQIVQIIRLCTYDETIFLEVYAA